MNTQPIDPGLMATKPLDPSLVSRDTYALSNPERIGAWYMKAALREDYKLMTGPRIDYAKEYALEQMSEAQSNDYNEAFNNKH